MTLFPLEKNFLLMILGVSSEIPNKEDCLQVFHQHLNCLTRGISSRKKVEKILVWEKISGRALDHLAIDIMYDNFNRFHFSLPSHSKQSVFLQWIFPIEVYFPVYYQSEISIYSKIKNRITFLSEATAIRFVRFNFGNPAILGIQDPWLSVLRLLGVWLYR